MRIRTVDAFTDSPYTGNPAAVMLLDDGGFPGDDRLRRLAAELNLSETAFAHPLPAGSGEDWALRWFTPVTEVDLCGHATLATAHLLHTDGLDGDGTVRFRTRSGTLTTTASPEGITLDFPTAHPSPADPPEGLAAALGTEAVRTYTTGTLGDLLVELADEQTVRDLSPDLRALGRLPYRGVIVTAQAADPTGSGRPGGWDYVSRLFAPSQGIPEDPVTGSAHTALAPLWSGRLGHDSLTGLQVSARSGLVRTTVKGPRTLLTGTAVTVLDAQLRTEF